MRKLKQIQQTLLNEIHRQRECYGNVDPDLLYRYDMVSELIDEFSP